MSLAQAILDVFKGRERIVAVGNDSGFAPQYLEHPLPADWLERRHLSGERCLGFYLMLEDNRVWCSCVDFDNKPERPDPNWQSKAELVYMLLHNVGLSPLVEVSASGSAAHVWLAFAEPVEAWLVRAFWRCVSAHLEVAMPEVYPRQDVLTGKGIGNLVRYPLWNKSYFPDVESEWAAVTPIEALLHFKRCDGYDLRTIAFQLGGGELKPEAGVDVSDDGSGISIRVKQRIAKKDTLLAKRWAGNMVGLGDSSRSALVQSIACELVRTYVPTAEIEQALRCWCRQFGYEKGERDDWIPRTVAKAYDFVTGRTEVKSLETTTLRDAVMEYIEMIPRGGVPHIPSGIIDVDNSIDGVGYGQMAVIAARPGHGKSAFGLQWVDNAANSGLPGLIISEEMTRLEIAKRALMSLSEIEEAKWKADGMVDHLRKEAAEHYSHRQKIHIVENCNTIDRCEEVIDQHCSIYGVKIVAVDYLQLLSGRGNSRYEDVTEISRRLKQSAQRNDCAVLAMCQLNREIEKRDGNQPRQSDLRESGQIEQDADLILFLQWPYKMGKRDEDITKYLVVAAKRRNGPIREQWIETTFDAERQRFGAPVGSKYDVTPEKYR